MCGKSYIRIKKFVLLRTMQCAQTSLCIPLPFQRDTGNEAEKCSHIQRIDAWSVVCDTCSDSRICLAPVFRRSVGRPFLLTLSNNYSSAGSSWHRKKNARDDATIRRQQNHVKKLDDARWTRHSRDRNGDSPSSRGDPPHHRGRRVRIIVMNFVSARRDDLRAIPWQKNSNSSGHNCVNINLKIQRLV